MKLAFVNGSLSSVKTLLLVFSINFVFVVAESATAECRKPPCLLFPVLIAELISLHRSVIQFSLPFNCSPKEGQLTPTFQSGGSAIGF